MLKSNFNHLFNLLLSGQLDSEHYKHLKGENRPVDLPDWSDPSMETLGQRFCIKQFQAVFAEENWFFGN